MRARVRSAALNLLVFSGGVVVALLLLELLLHAYNPFQARIKGNRIVLLTNKQYHINNDIIPAVDPVVTVTRNSLGFRGPDPPKDFAKYLTIFTIGGSTTQCFFLSDDKTWTARLGQRLDRSFRNVWINNAGLDGHSTYGHLVLLEDMIRQRHPKLALLLAGANDVGRNPNEEWDAENVRGKISFRSPTSFVKSLSAYSEVAALAANAYRSLNAYRHGLLHQYIDLRKQGYTDAPLEAEKQFVTRYAANAALPAFERRLKQIVSVARDSGIGLILLTQPLLAGGGTDDVTQLDLGRITIGPGVNGKMWWSVLELYNGVTRRVGRQENVPVVDLARRLPKTSRYFYDFFHFTNEGAQAVADLIYQEICPLLHVRFAAYVTTGCQKP